MPNEVCQMRFRQISFHKKISNIYRVRGTIRDLKNEKRVNELKQLCPDAKHPLELKEADLMQPEGWIEALEECTYVIHTASPTSAEQPKHENELIEPALQGKIPSKNFSRSIESIFLHFFTVSGLPCVIILKWGILVLS